MKPRLTVLIAIAVAIGSSCWAQPAPRVPLIGYIDRKGAVVEPAIYTNGSTFFRGEWVAVLRDGKAGYLNLRTKASTGLRFDEVAIDSEWMVFANGPEPVRMGEKWGFADKSGKVVIAARFDSAKSFGTDGLAIVGQGDTAGSGPLQGFIDKTGSFVISPKYEFLRRLAGGIAAFKSGGFWGAIDGAGNEIIPARLAFLGEFSDDGLAPASLKGRIGEASTRYGYVDRSGSFVIPEVYRYAGNFRPFDYDGGLDAPEGFARVVLENGEAAYIDRTGKVTTRFKSGLSVFGISPNGLVRVQDQATARYGFADRTGAIVIPVRFEQVGGFGAEGLAMAQEHGRAGYIRADGRWAIEPRFTSAGRFDAFGQAQVEENGTRALIDGTGHTVATLVHGTYFFLQESAYAAFKTFPPQVDYPTEQFGGWRLERRLYAHPEVPSMMPAPTGSIHLTFQSKDGLVRWAFQTEGWVVDLALEQGVEHKPDLITRMELARLPANAVAAIELINRQLAGIAKVKIATTVPDASEHAAQRERLAPIATNKGAYLAQLEDSAHDLDRALQAMKTRIVEQFGALSGRPCMPPQCIY